MKNVFAILLVGFLFSCGNSSDKKSVAGGTVSGKDIFNANCTTCHGEDGKLCLMGAKDLTISTLDKIGMRDIILNGKTTMAPYKTILSEKEVDAVTDFVTTLKK